MNETFSDNEGENSLNKISLLGRTAVPLAG